MPTAEEILDFLKEQGEPEVCYVKFPRGTLADQNRDKTIGRISRGPEQTIELAPVSLVCHEGIFGEERLKFSKTLTFPGKQSDLSEVDFAIHGGIEFMVFGRRWENSPLRVIKE